MNNDTAIKTPSYKASTNHLYSEIGNEAVILDLASGTYYGLNEVGVDLWQWLQEPKTEETILQLLLSKYDVNLETARQDFQNILEEMLAAGLVEIVD